MKLWYRRGMAMAALCAVGLAIAWMAQLYFQYVSQQIYEECADHLVEVYGQVDRSFISFLENNWGSLDDWVHHIQIEDEEGVLMFLQGRQQNWKFSQFYFLSSDGRGLTPEGAAEQFKLERAGDALFQKRERAMFMETLSSGQAVTLFAIPVEKGSYRGFDYDAIAVSYSNADMVASLDTNAFSGQSMCLVVYTDGSVLLSTQESGSAFGNYPSYLKAGSDLGDQRLAEIRRDWENSASGVVRCEIGGVSHYISYLPVGYEACILLGVVPESAASASMLKIQKATVDVLIKVSVLLGALIVVWIVLSYRRKTKRSSLELRYRERMFDTLSNNVDDIFLMLDSGTLKVDWDTWFDTNLEKDGTYTKEDFALMPVFMNTEPSGTYEGGNLNMMMVNKQGEHVEEALEFLSFCAQSENDNKAFDGISTVSCFKGQTTNIQSDMVTEAQGSISLHGRASTANPKIIGYTQQEMGAAVQKLLQGEVDAAGCVALMDEYRIAAARELGAEGF